MVSNVQINFCGAQVSPLLDQLVATGFYVDDELAEQVRRTAGEAVE